jgi:hypothetical protein
MFIVLDQESTLDFYSTYSLKQLNFVSTPKSQILMKYTNRIIFYALFIYDDDQISVTFSYRLSGVVVNVLTLSAVDSHNILILS